MGVRYINALGLSESPGHSHVAVAERRYGRLHGPAPRRVSLPAASTLIAVAQLGYERHLVEIEAVPVLD